MIRLADPLALLLLLVPLAAAALARARKRPAPTFTFSESELVEEMGRSIRTRIPGALVGLRAIGFVLAVVALARPQSGVVEERIVQEGIDIAIALDISSSMKAEDFEPLNRLEVAKRVVTDFVAQREGDRLALVVFAAKALTKCPLVLDGEILRGLVEEVRIGEIEDGTAIGTAIGTAVNRLRAGTGTSRVLVLVTDGVNNRGEIDPLTAAGLAVPFGIKIHTIGVGTTGTVPVTAVGPFGRTMRVPMQVKIDEDTLRTIAGRTGGTYFRATDSDALTEIFRTIDELEESPAETLRITRYRELFPYALGPGLALVALAEVLRRTLFRVSP